MNQGTLREQGAIDFTGSVAIKHYGRGYDHPKYVRKIY